MIKPRLPLLVSLLLLVTPVALAAEKPNIVIILTDDQGYADVGFNPHHGKEVHTPHTDRLAREGIVCTQAYTTGHVCSPTRAGLMTGRYQQRFGIYTAGEGGSGVPLDEVFLPQYLKPAGYVCGALGKWHLGLTLEYNAVNRGFDEFYGFMGRGAHDYFDLSINDHPIYRGLNPIEDRGYLTTRITEEAVSFITRHRETRDGQRPFLLYVAYNAVHAPPQAPAEDVRRQTGDETRDTLMAMLRHLDAGVGRIVDTLKQHGLFDNTLLVFLTDNGGSRVMHAVNTPLRGFKQDDYEGGIRVPMIVSWPARLPRGGKCDVPMLSIDILPTALAAADVTPPADRVLDGKNLLPALRGEVEQVHEQMYWSSGGLRGKWAIRTGRWKLVGVKNQIELFDLEADLSETTDLSARFPEKVAELTKLHDAWLAQMADPVHGGGKRWDPAAPPQVKRSRQQKLEEREQRKQERDRER